MAKVDIIIPAYNAAHFLPAALDSVLAQTVEDWRILLVDDGSTDETPALAAAYQRGLGDRLKYIPQPNAGLSNARNTAIRHATAEFLALLDADDVWMPFRLEETLKAFAGRPDVGLVYGFVDRIDAEDRVVATFDRRNRHAEGSIATYIYRREIDLPCPTMTFRRACVEEVGTFDETMRSTEDRDLWLRIAQRHAVALAPKVVAHYRTSPGAMTGDPERMLRAQLQFVKKHFGEPGCGRLARRIALGNMYRQRAEAFAQRGQGQIAVKSALRALAYYPLHASTARTALSLLWRWSTGRLGGVKLVTTA